MKLALALVASLALPALAQAETTTWNIDPAHSTASFAVRHAMVSTVRGDFTKVTGTITTEGTDVSKAKVDATIDAASVDTRVAQRDAHLKSPDFFDVQKFPNITFKSTKIHKKGAHVLLTGDLTIHGVTKPVTLTATVSPPTKDPMGNLRIGAEATGKIDRKDFGLTWNKTLDKGGVLVSDDVQLTIDVEAIQQAGQKSAQK
ncbi:MAG: YceI family protein [Deltaproteobacteria bacterium]